MKDEEREEVKRCLIESGGTIHKAALIMLIEAQMRGASERVAEAAVSTAALLVAAQMFNGTREQFVASARAAFSCGEAQHPGTETRQ